MRKIIFLLLLTYCISAEAYKKEEKIELTTVEYYCGKVGDTNMTPHRAPRSNMIEAYLSDDILSIIKIPTTCMILIKDYEGGILDSQTCTTDSIEITLPANAVSVEIYYNDICLYGKL